MELYVNLNGGGNITTSEKLLFIFEQPRVKREIEDDTWRRNDRFKEKYVEKKLKYVEIKSDGNILEKDVFIVEKIIR